MLVEYLILFTEKRPLEREGQYPKEFPHCALMVSGPSARVVADEVCVSLNFVDEFKLKAAPCFKVVPAAEMPGSIWALFDAEIADYTNCSADDGSQDPCCRWAAYHQKARQLEVSHRTDMRLDAPGEQTDESPEPVVPQDEQPAEDQQASKVAAADGAPPGEWVGPMSKTEVARRITGKHQARWRSVKSLFEATHVKSVSKRQVRVRVDHFDGPTRERLKKDS